jgi:hypothetical protein
MNIWEEDLHNDRTINEHMFTVFFSQVYGGADAKNAPN